MNHYHTPDLEQEQLGSGWTLPGGLFVNIPHLSMYIDYLSKSFLFKTFKVLSDFDVLEHQHKIHEPPSCLDSEL